MERSFVEMGKAVIGLYNLEFKLSELVDSFTPEQRERIFLARAIQETTDLYEEVRRLRMQCEDERNQYGVDIGYYKKPARR